MLIRFIGGLGRLRGVREGERNGGERGEGSMTMRGLA